MKRKLIEVLAITAAATSIMAMAAPAFASTETLGPTVETSESVEAVQTDRDEIAETDEQEISADEEMQSTEENEKLQDAEVDEEIPTIDSLMGTKIDLTEEPAGDYINGAGQHIYKDKYCTATVNADGVSGKIEFSDPSFFDYNYIWVNGRRVNPNLVFNNIGGVSLQDIVKFHDGGYLSYMHFDYGYYDIHGVGPEYIWNGSGHVVLTDLAGNSKTLSLWSSQGDSDFTSFIDDCKNWNNGKCGGWITCIEWY